MKVHIPTTAASASHRLTWLSLATINLVLAVQPLVKPLVQIPPMEDRINTLVLRMEERVSVPIDYCFHEVQLTWYRSLWKHY